MWVNLTLLPFHSKYVSCGAIQSETPAYQLSIFNSILYYLPVDGISG